jgi:dTDP-4-amino-4,6-dideoxygalactose transaminase
MNIPLVDLKAQYLSIKAEIDQAMQSVLDSTGFIGGSTLTRFEQAFADACGLPHCVGVGNGTDAIYLALRAAGLGPGDEVLVPANTFIATAEAVSLTGAKVVFVDVDETNACMDPAQAAAKITKACKAMVCVHLYGRTGDMDALCALASQHGLLLLEDAAQAHLASWKGRPVGSFGQAACFSFYPGKNLGAYGDAGAVVTNDAQLADKVRRIANHGRSGKYDHEMEGVNSRLDSLQAAILTAKLPHLEAWTQSRQRAAATYRELLAPQLLGLTAEPAGGRHVYHLFVIESQQREEIKNALVNEGIACGIHYPVPLPHLAAYRYLGHQPGDFPVSERLASQILSLPMYPELTKEQIERVAAAVNRVVK